MRKRHIDSLVLVAAEHLLSRVAEPDQGKLGHYIGEIAAGQAVPLTGEEE